MTRTGVLRALGLTLMLGGIGLGGGCARCDDDGPVEEAVEELGEDIDEAAEDVEDAID